MSPLGLFLTRLLMFGATFCLAFDDLTENPKPPDYLMVANHFAELIKKDIERRLGPISADIEDMKSIMIDSCNTAPVLDIPAIWTPLLNDQAKKFDAIERQLNETLQRTEALEGQLASLQEGIEERISEESDRLHGRLFTREEMEEVVRREAEELKKSCDRDQRLTALQNGVTEVKETMQEMINENVEMKSIVEEYISQNVPSDVMTIKSFMEVVVKEVERLALNTRNFSITLENVLFSIESLTATPPPPAEEEEEEEEHTTGPIYPCLDSVFTGTQNMKVCDMAARFKKCSLPLVSFHCCQTCTSRGLIPEMGPWRHLDLTRHVKSFQIIRVFAP